MAAFLSGVTRRNASISKGAEGSKKSVKESTTRAGSRRKPPDVFNRATLLLTIFLLRKSLLLPIRIRHSTASSLKRRILVTYLPILFVHF